MTELQCKKCGFVHDLTVDCPSRCSKCGFLHTISPCPSSYPQNTTGASSILPWQMYQPGYRIIGTAIISADKMDDFVAVYLGPHIDSNKHKKNEISKENRNKWV